MTIRLESFQKAIEKGLNPSKYLFLLIKQDGSDYYCNDFLSNDEELSLLLNDYLTKDLKLTKKSIELLKEIEGIKVSNKIDNKYEELHKKLQTELTVLTSKKQKMLQGKYSYLPNSKDLASRLSRIIKKYKLEDWNRVEKLLINYIFTCHKSNWQFTPTLEYYIEKNNGSKLATDYFNDDVKEEIEVKIEPKDIKNLF